MNETKGWCSPLEWCNRECGRGQLLNDKTCKCETFDGKEVEDMEDYCDIHLTCPPGTMFDNHTCSCVQDQFACSLQCPDFLGLVLDEEACECVPTDECTLRACDDGQYVNTTACECVYINEECPELECFSDQIKNWDSCACECERTCPDDYFQDPHTCACLSDCEVECEWPTIPDYENCSC